MRPTDSTPMGRRVSGALRVVPPSVARTSPARAAETAADVTLKVLLVAPSAIFSVAGVLAALSVSLSAIVSPPAAAGVKAG